MSNIDFTKTEWFGNVPDNWNLLNIGSLYLLRNEKVSDKDYPPLSVTMQGILPQLETAAKSNAHDDRKLVRKGDFAINSRSDRRGSCGIADRDGSVSLINTVLVPRTDIDSNYFNWLFHTSQFADEFYRWGHGIVDDLWTTSWKEMKNIVVPVPPKMVQSKISSAINQVCSKIDLLIANQKSQIEKLKEYKISLISLVMTKGLDYNANNKYCEVECIGSVPESWNKSKIKNKYHVVLGKMIDSSNCLEEEKENYLCAANIKWEGIDINVNKKMRFTDVEKEQYLLSQGDVLIMEGGNAGTTCIYQNEFYPCYIQNSVLRCRGVDYNMNKYLYYWMYKLFHAKYIYVICNKATFMHYTKEKVENTPIIMPRSSTEQELIVNYLDKKCCMIDELISIKQNKIKKLNQYKKSFIYEYVTGKKEL